MNIKEYLLPSESLLWEGKPNSKKSFSKNDLYITIFSLVVGIIGFSSVIYVIANKVPLSNGSTDYRPFYVFLVVFGFAIIYNVHFRFTIKKKTREKTSYYITNKRVIVTVGKKFFSTNIDEASQCLFVQHNQDDSDTISFEVDGLKNHLATDVYPSFMIKRFPIVFANIYDAANVQSIIKGTTSK